MIEKFVVPEPSAEATDRAEAAVQGDVAFTVITPEVLRAAYREDMPDICLREVQRFAEHLCYTAAKDNPSMQVAIRTEYLLYGGRFIERRELPPPDMGGATPDRGGRRSAHTLHHEAPEAGRTECLPWCSLNSPGHAGKCER